MTYSSTTDAIASSSKPAPIIVGRHLDEVHHRIVVALGKILLGIGNGYVEVGAVNLELHIIVVLLF